MRTAGVWTVAAVLSAALWMTAGARGVSTLEEAVAQASSGDGKPILLYISSG